VVLDRVIDENERGIGDHGEGALFAAMNLELWMRCCLEGRAPAEIRMEAEDLTRGGSANRAR
jgi:hypothetical protein